MHKFHIVSQYLKILNTMLIIYIYISLTTVLLSYNFQEILETIWNEWRWIRVLKYLYNLINNILKYTLITFVIHSTNNYFKVCWDDFGSFTTILSLTWTYNTKSSTCHKRLFKVILTVMVMKITWYNCTDLLVILDQPKKCLYPYY